MVRLALLIVSLLGMFLLNACGGNSHNPSNLDTTDAVALQKGKFSGRLTDVTYKKYDEKGRTVDAKQTQIFNVENSNIEVDWDTKKVILTTEITPDHNSDKSNTAVPLVLEGHFNDEGIAYLSPVTDKGGKANAIAGVTCKDNLCQELKIDMGADVQVNGKVNYQEQQMSVKNPNPLTVEMPAPEVKAEIVPDSSGLNNTGDKTVQPKTEAEKKAEAAKAAADKKAADEKAKKEAAELAAAADENDDSQLESMIEPGVPALPPSVLRPEMRQRPASETGIKLNDYSESPLFPYDLGEKYPAKAQGFYSFCPRGKKDCASGSLVKGIDVTLDGIGNLVKKLGFTSADRSDKRYYGSGLLVKSIEEVGRMYSKAYPDDTFMVDDLAKKEGGPIYKVDSKGRIQKYKNGRNKMAHASHQNGLDVDISLPRKASVVYDYDKVWTIAKSFVSLGFVDVIFLNKARITALCSHLKKSGKLSETDQKIFRHFYKESGHTSHMHVRLKCTNHNRGCFPANYTASQYGSCK